MRQIHSITCTVLLCVLTLSACADPVTDDAAKKANSADILETVEQDSNIERMLPANIRQTGSITVSINAEVEPIKFVDSNGEVAGLNPDLLRAAARVLGIEVEFQQGTGDALVPGLEAKRFDAIASIGDFVERQTRIDFIDYLQNGTGIIVGKDFAKDKASLRDLCGRRIGFARGSSQQGSLAVASRACTDSGLPPIKLNGYQNSGAGILSVRSDEADGYWGDLPQMAYNARKDPDLFKVVYTEQGSVIGIGINKDNPQLRDALRAALLKLVEDGVYTDLLEAWNLKDFALPDLPVNSKNKLKG